MKLQNFHVSVADWSLAPDRSALMAIRQQVFVVEQAVPQARDRDGLDAACWHVLARDEDGQPIGCARMSPERKIGRMAVLDEWRGNGVGAAMLRELVARARAAGWSDVGLAAQVSAIGFYEREGFVAYGEVFEDAGLAHRSMTLALDPAAQTENHAVAITVEALPVTSRLDTTVARTQVLIDAQRRLCIYQPRLGNDSYASADELAQIRRVATAGRGALIRILLHDPAAALRNDHRLLALVQRLPSFLQIRMPIGRGRPVQYFGLPA